LISLNLVSLPIFTPLSSTAGRGIIFLPRRLALDNDLFGPVLLTCQGKRSRTAWTPMETMNPKSQSQLNLQTFALPPPEPIRTLRKFQSHQNLSSNPQSAHQPRPQLQRNVGSHRDHSDEAPQHHTQLPSAQSHGRSRSNSEIVTSSNLFGPPTRRRPVSGRKSGSTGLYGRRSGLDTLLREGPPGGNVTVGLQDLRYLVLSTRVDSDSDGMVGLIP